MKNRISSLSLIFFSILLASIISSCGSKKISISPDEAKSIAEEAYIYGYPWLRWNTHKES